MGTLPELPELRNYCEETNSGILLGDVVKNEGSLSHFSEKGLDIRHWAQPCKVTHPGMHSSRVKSGNLVLYSDFG